MIFIGYLLGQFSGSFLIATVFVAWASMPYAYLGGAVGGALMCLLLSHRYIRVAGGQTFRDAIGWAAGDARGLVTGGILGVALAVVFGLLVTWLMPYVEANGQGDLAAMANTPGTSRFIWTVLGLVIAPPLEEFLFRGVLFTGIARARGPLAAAVLTTLLFCFVHLSEVRHYWPALGMIALLGLGTVGLRIRTGCLGPSVALHLAYNGVLVAAVYLAP